MELKVQFEFLFVGRDEEGFVKNYFYELDGEEKSIKQAGKIFVNFEMVNNMALGEEIGELVFRTAKTYFFHDLNEDPYIRFEEALKVVNKEIAHIQNEKQFQFVSNLNVIIGAVVEDELFLSQAGDAEAYLIRRKHVSVISEGLSEGDGGHNEAFLNIASGTLEKGDTLVFSSTRLLRYLSKTELGSAFTNSDLPSMLQELKELVGTEIQKKTGILGIHVYGMKVAPITVSEKSKENVLIPFLNLKDGFGKGWNFFSVLFSVLMRFFRSLRQFGRERLLVVVIVMIIILIIGVVNVRKHTQEKAYLQGLESILTEVQTLINSAETKGAYDKKTAGVLLNNAEAKALEVLNSGFFRSRSSQFLEQIGLKRDELDNIMRVTDVRIVADLADTGRTVDSLGMIHARDATYVYSSDQLYRVVLNTIEDPVTFDETDRVVDGVYFEDRDSLVFMTNSNRIIEYSDGRLSYMDTDDGKWHGGVDIRAYSNKIYLLAPGENQIWRYVRRRDKYGVAEVYNVDADLSDVIGLAIDGSIYGLRSDGGLLKLYTGELQGFAVSKEPLIPVSKPTKLYTEFDLNQIYILESTKNRVVILNKDLKTGDAVYAGQYVFDELDGVRDFYVDKISNKIYLLDKTKVYEFSL